MEDFTFKKAFSISLKQFKSNFLILITLPLLLSILNICSSKISQWFSIPTIICSLVFSYWLIQLALKINKKEKLNFKEDFMPEKKGFLKMLLSIPALALTFMIFIIPLMIPFMISSPMSKTSFNFEATSAAMIIIMGILLFVLVLSLFVRFLFTSYFIYDKNMGVLDSFDNSWKLSFKRIISLVIIQAILTIIIVTFALLIVKTTLYNSSITYIISAAQIIISTLLSAFSTLLFTQYYLDISKSAKKAEKLKKGVFKISVILKESFKKLFKNYWGLVSWSLILYIAFVVTIAVTWALVQKTSLYASNSIAITNWISNTLFIALAAFLVTLFGYFVIQISKKTAENEKLKFSQMKPQFKGIKNFFSKLWASSLLTYFLTVIIALPFIIVWTYMVKAAAKKADFTSLRTLYSLFPIIIAPIFVLAFLSILSKVQFTLFKAIGSKKSTFICLKESIEITPFWKTLGLNLTTFLIVMLTLLIPVFIGYSIIRISYDIQLGEGIMNILIIILFVFFILPFSIIPSGVAYKTVNKNNKPDLSEDKASSDIPVQNNLEIE